jgi:hypothetical protein
LKTNSTLVRRFLVFAVPFLLFFGFSSLALLWFGESYRNIDAGIEEKRPYLIGFEFHEENYPYLKWKTVSISERRKLLALGSSRVLQFREEMFDSSFYNAGYTITSLTELIPFLQTIPSDKKPEFLLLGLDHWMFNQAFDSLEKEVSSDKWMRRPSPFSAEEKVHFRFFSQFFSGKYDFSNLEMGGGTRKKIGLNAHFKYTGFRNDGSMLYGLQISKLLVNDSTAADYHFTSTFDRIRDGNRRFQYGEAANIRALALLDSVLDYCTREKITVITFLPPFARAVLNRMESGGKHAYIGKLRATLPLLIKEKGHEFYDFTDIASCNSSDEELIDGFHGSERTYVKMLISMLDSGSVLNKLTSSVRLREDLLKAKNRYSVYAD